MYYYTKIKNTQHIDPIMNNSSITYYENIHKMLRVISSGKMCRGSPHISPKYLLQQIGAKNTITIFTEKNDGVIVFVCSRDACMILGICTAATASKGTGQQLVSAVLEFCRGSGAANHVFLEAYDDVAPFYIRKFGFERSTRKINIPVQLSTSSDSDSDDDDTTTTRSIKGERPKLYSLALEETRKPSAEETIKDTRSGGTKTRSRNGCKRGQTRRQRRISRRHALKF